MTINTTPSTLTNVEIAEALNLSTSGVSRLRSGERFPSLALMRQIELQFKWTISDQVDARFRGMWHSKFDRVLQGIAKTREIPTY